VLVGTDDGAVDEVQRKVEEMRQREVDAAVRAQKQAQERAGASRKREERARRVGLPARQVHFEQRGDHAIWCTDHKTKRMVHGLASTSTINAHRYSLDASKCMIEFPIPLLVSHAHFGNVGEIVLARRSPRDVYVIAALHDDSQASDYAWELIRQGELRAFSGAAERGSSPEEAGEVLGVKFYGAWTLGEVSLCKSGANPDCRAEIFNPRCKIR
jgi:hypothetical protein